MSVKTWMEEFYTKPSKKMTKLEAIEQSLKKYEGLTQKNLNKHKVEIDNLTLFDGEFKDFDFNVKSCSLCVKYYRRIKVTDDCGKCPLAQTGKTCFEDNSPFHKFQSGDSRPMRATLRRLLKKEQARL